MARKKPEIRTLQPWRPPLKLRLLRWCGSLFVAGVLIWFAVRNHESTALGWINTASLIAAAIAIPLFTRVASKPYGAKWARRIATGLFASALGAQAIAWFVLRNGR